MPITGFQKRAELLHQYRTSFTVLFGAQGTPALGLPVWPPVATQSPPGPIEVVTGQVPRPAAPVRWRVAAYLKYPGEQSPLDVAQADVTPWERAPFSGDHSSDAPAAQIVTDAPLAGMSAPASAPLEQRQPISVAAVPQEWSPQQPFLAQPTTAPQAFPPASELQPVPPREGDVPSERRAPAAERSNGQLSFSQLMAFGQQTQQSETQPGAPALMYPAVEQEVWASTPQAPITSAAQEPFFTAGALSAAPMPVEAPFVPPSVGQEALPTAPLAERTTTVSSTQGSPTQMASEQVGPLDEQVIVPETAADSATPLPSMPPVAAERQGSEELQLAREVASPELVAPSPVTVTPDQTPAHQPSGEELLAQATRVEPDGQALPEQTAFESGRPVEVEAVSEVVGDVKLPAGVVTPDIPSDQSAGSTAEPAIIQTEGMAVTSTSTEEEPADRPPASFFEPYKPIDKAFEDAVRKAAGPLPPDVQLVMPRRARPVPFVPGPKKAPEPELPTHSQAQVQNWLDRLNKVADASQTDGGVSQGRPMSLAELMTWDQIHPRKLPQTAPVSPDIPALDSPTADLPAETPAVQDAALDVRTLAAPVMPHADAPAEAGLAQDEGQTLLSRATQVPAQPAPESGPLTDRVIEPQPERSLEVAEGVSVQPVSLDAPDRAVASPADLTALTSPAEVSEPPSATPWAAPQRQVEQAQNEPLINRSPETGPATPTLPVTPVSPMGSDEVNVLAHLTTPSERPTTVSSVQVPPAQIESLGSRPIAPEVPTTVSSTQGSPMPPVAAERQGSEELQLAREVASSELVAPSPVTVTPDQTPAHQPSGDELLSRATRVEPDEQALPEQTASESGRHGEVKAVSEVVSEVAAVTSVAASDSSVGITDEVVAIQTEGMAVTSTSTEEEPADRPPASFFEPYKPIDKAFEDAVRKAAGPLPPDVQLVMPRRARPVPFVPGPKKAPEPELPQHSQAQVQNWLDRLNKVADASQTDGGVSQGRPMSLAELMTWDQTHPRKLPDTAEPDAPTVASEGQGVETDTVVQSNTLTPPERVSLPASPAQTSPSPERAAPTPASAPPMAVSALQTVGDQPAPTRMRARAVARRTEEPKGSSDPTDLLRAATAPLPNRPEALASPTPQTPVAAPENRAGEQFTQSNSSSGGPQAQESLTDTPAPSVQATAPDGPNARPVGEAAPKAARDVAANAGLGAEPKPRLPGGVPAAQAAFAPARMAETARSTPDLPQARALRSQAKIEQALAQPAHTSPLPLEARARLAPLLGTDVGGVQIVQSARAAEAVSELGADALAVGNTILLGGDQQLGSARSLGLLAHELTHVLRDRDPGFVPASVKGQRGSARLDEEALAERVERQVRRELRSKAGPGPEPTPDARPAGDTWGGLPAPWEAMPHWDAPSRPAPARSSAPVQAAAAPAAPAAAPVVRAASSDRSVGDGGSGGGSDSGGASSQGPAVGFDYRRTNRNSPDLDRLAFQIYRILKRRLSEEARRIR